MLADAATGRGGAWSTNGTIAFAANANSALVRVSASGGAVTPLTTFDPAHGAVAHNRPQFLPDGRQFLYFQRSNNPAEHSGIYVGTLDSPARARVLATDSAGLYSSGFLWFVQAGSLFAQAFDARELRVAGEPRHVADGVGHYPNLGYMSMTVSATGVIAFGPAITFTSIVQTRGRSGAADGAATPPGMYRSPRLSPDEKSVALSISVAGGSPDIWVLDVARGAMSRAVSEPLSDWFPAWPPDSDRLFFGSTRSGSTSVFEKTLGGTDERLVASTQFDGRATYPIDISGDGQFLAFQIGTQRGYDLGMLSLTGEATASVFLATPFNEVQGRFAPNGRWLAYASDESGRFEIYVRPFPAASGQTQVSLAGGMQPEWRRDGKELFYITAGGKLTAVPVTTDGPAFAAGTPQALFDVEVPEPSAPYQGDYAVAADGQHFFVNTVVDQPTRPALTVILNWTPDGTR